MTNKRIENERNLARECFIEQFDRMLAAGKITQQRHDELVAKVTAA